MGTFSSYTCNACGNTATELSGIGFMGPPEVDFVCAICEEFEFSSADSPPTCADCDVTMVRLERPSWDSTEPGRPLKCPECGSNDVSTSIGLWD